MSELLPCPFCGGEAIIAEARPVHISRGIYKESPYPFLATCTNNDCKAEMSHKTEEGAIKAWNTRFPWPKPIDDPNYIKPNQEIPIDGRTAEERSGE